MSGGSEVWINASDWRRAAAVVREQNIRQRERSGDGAGPGAGFFGRRVIFLRLRDEPLGPNPECQKTPAKTSHNKFAVRVWLSVQSPTVKPPVSLRRTAPIPGPES